MKSLALSFAQLIAVVMATLALAVSTAAVAQWADADVARGGAVPAQAVLVSDANR